MTEAELLKSVKSGLMITTPLFDDVLMIHIRDVKSYLKTAGVKDFVIESEDAVGVILRGVSDLWNNGSGDVNFSPYFRDRATQLSLIGGGENVST